MTASGKATGHMDEGIRFGLTNSLGLFVVVLVFDVVTSKGLTRVADNPLPLRKITTHRCVGSDYPLGTGLARRSRNIPSDI